MKNSIIVFLVFVIISSICFQGCSSHQSTDKVGSNVSTSQQNDESKPLMHRDYFFQTPANVDSTNLDQQFKNNILSFSGALDSYKLSSGQTRWNHKYTYIWIDSVFDGRSGRIETVEKYAAEHKNDALLISTVCTNGSLAPGFYNIILLTDEFILDSKYLRDDMHGVKSVKAKK